MCIFLADYSELVAKLYMIQPKFFDYTLCLYAYTNVNTSQDVYYVARVNDYVKEMFYTDA